MLSSQGFTLLEVVVALLIITTLVATFAPLLTSSIMRIKAAGELTRLNYETRAYMEEALAREQGVSQKLQVTWEGDSVTINGIVVEQGKFVSFISPKE